MITSYVMRARDTTDAARTMRPLIGALRATEPAATRRKEPDMGYADAHLIQDAHISGTLLFARPTRRWASVLRSITSEGGYGDSVLWDDIRGVQVHYRGCVIRERTRNPLIQSAVNVECVAFRFPDCPIECFK